MKVIEKLICLLMIPNLGRRTLLKYLNNIILETYPIEELIKQLHKVGVIKSEINIEQIKEETQKHIFFCKEKDIQIIHYFDDLYPIKFKNIPDSPLVLFIKGNRTLLYSKCVAVVGTRTPMLYSIYKTSQLTKKLVYKGNTIVAGLALGVDTIAHKTAIKLSANTIAFMPCGPDQIYPAENATLAKRVLESNGCLIYEYFPGNNINKYQFIERDRLQSGISESVFVIETKKNGGTMHTARCCLQQNKKLYCMIPPKNLVDSLNFKGNMSLLSNPTTNAFK